ncbi:MAG TPA: hypothetical protein VFG05_02945 [Methylocella sp.]|nr:hypothetical protein [Methylocella sp.]
MRNEIKAGIAFAAGAAISLGFAAQGMAAPLAGTAKLLTAQAAGSAVQLAAMHQTPGTGKAGHQHRHCHPNGKCHSHAHGARHHK